MSKLSNSSKPSKRKKINRVFGFKLNKTAKKYDKANKRKHRNVTPYFAQNYQGKEYAYTTHFFLQRCETFDPQKCKFLIAVREAKFQRTSIRLERRELLLVLFPTLISYCDFSLSNPYLFEVRANVEHIATMCRQLYTYTDPTTKKTRNRYDTVLNAIEMLEEAELIKVAREYDKRGRRYKPMRIWLNVEFFLSLGVTEVELRNILAKFHKYQYRNNSFNQNYQNYEKHVARLNHKGVADVEKQYSLKNLLIKERKALLGEKLMKFVATPNNATEYNAEDDDVQSCFRSPKYCTTSLEIAKLRKRLEERSLRRQRIREKAANDIAYRKWQLQSYEVELSKPVEELSYC